MFSKKPSHKHSPSLMLKCSAHPFSRAASSPADMSCWRVLTGFSDSLQALRGDMPSTRQILLQTTLEIGRLTMAHLYTLYGVSKTLIRSSHSVLCLPSLSLSSLCPPPWLDCPQAGSVVLPCRDISASGMRPARSEAASVNTLLTRLSRKYGNSFLFIPQSGMSNTKY